ncbi:TPA: hypothetical protein MYP03_004742 [Citrobacter freundii]|nr:hypothetical protein [Citrobacter freundii]
MTNFILIMTLISTNGVSVATAELNDRLACQEAGQKWLNQVDKFSRHVYFTCAKASEEKVNK